MKVYIIGILRCELECEPMSAEELLIQLDARAPLAMCFELVGAGTTCACVRAYVP